MIYEVSDKMCNLLFLRGLISERDREIYLYGMELLFSTIINNLIALICGVVFQKFIHTIIFLVCYCTIKSFVGGYHANSHKSCIITFSIIYFCILGLVRITQISEINIFLIIGWVMSWILILIFAPVEDMNKLLTKEEKEKFRKKGRIMFAGLSLITLIAYIFFGNQLREYILFSVLAFNLSGIILIAGKFKNYLRKEHA